MQIDLLDESDDNIVDSINDILTSYCESDFEESYEIATYIEKADATLRMRGLRLDFDDVEAAKLDELDIEPDSVTTYNFPVYGLNDEQTELDLTVNYAYDADVGKFMIDMELVYEWEIDGGDDEPEDYE